MGHSRYSYDPGSTLIVRVAGLPMEILLPLRFSRTMCLIEELFEVEHQLAAEANALSDALYAVISDVAEKQTRQSLIALRRSIFQSQLPKKPELAPAVWAALPEELAERVSRWLERVRQRFALLEQGNGVLEDEWQEKRYELQRIVKQSEPFQQGLLLSSKELFVDTMKWLQKTELRPDRQLEIGIFTYLSRAATKTSPFSTFMSTGRGHWGHDEALFAHDASWHRVSAIELKWASTHRIAYELARLPELRSALILKLNPSLIEEERHLSLLGWQKGETVLRVTDSPAIRHIVQLLRTLEAPTYEMIVQSLAQSDTPEQINKVRQYLDRLIKIGLLQLDMGIADQEVDYPGRLLEWLHSSTQEARQGHRPQVEAIIPLLQQIHDCLHQYATTMQSARRFELRNMIFKALESIYQHLELIQRGIPPVSSKLAFFENTLIEGLDLRCSREGWQKVLDDLALVQELTAPFDWHLPGRQGLATFFVDHYGSASEVNLLHLYEDYRREIQQPGGWRTGYRISGSHLKDLFEASFFSSVDHLPELQQLSQLHRAFRQQFVPQESEASPVRRLDAEKIREFIASFPAFIRPPRSLGFYGQALLVAPGEGNGRAVPHLVLNAIRTGFGRGEARLRYLEALAGATVPSPSIRRICEGEAPLWVDILGVFGSNTCLHIAQTPYELTYPGAVSNRPSEEQLPLNDLTVRYDSQCNRLRLFSRQLQRELLPVHLGMLADSWQPPLYRFLLSVFGETGTDALLMIAQIPDITGMGADMAVRSYPRIYLGSLVLGRASWMMGVQQIPKREKGMTPFEYMLHVQRWLATHQLPQECFVRIPLDLLPPTMDNNGGASANLLKDRKPLYIDFSNYFSVMMFEQMVHHAEQLKRPEDRILLFQEVLPRQEDLQLSDGRATYVSELLIELTRKD